VTYYIVFFVICFAVGAYFYDVMMYHEY